MVMPPRSHSPLYFWHASHGARFVESAGWQLPACYTTVRAEADLVQTGLAIADVTAFARVSLRGQGVPALTHALLGDSPASSPRGVAQLPAPSPVLACRLTADHLLLLGTSTVGFADDRLNDLCRDHAIARCEATFALTGFWVFGPATDDLLRLVTPFDVGPCGLPASSCAETSLAGVQALLVRAPFRDLAFVGVYVSWDVAEYAWERLFDAGRPLGITPIGLEAFQGF
jgi:glycine cleavage system aminomethyltransferase T